MPQTSTIRQPNQFVFPLWITHKHAEGKETAAQRGFRPNRV